MSLVQCLPENRESIPRILCFLIICYILLLLLLFVIYYYIINRNIKLTIDDESATLYIDTDSNFEFRDTA